METTDFLDSEEIINIRPQGANHTLNVMCILGYIGNTLFFLLFLGYKHIPALTSSPELQVYIIDLVSRNLEVLNTYFTLTFGLIDSLIIISIIGLIGSHKGKTWGFVSYAIFNGIWAISSILILNPFSIILGLISIGFIVIIGVNYKK